MTDSGKDMMQFERKNYVPTHLVFDKDLVLLEKFSYKPFFFF